MKKRNKLLLAMATAGLCLTTSLPVAAQQAGDILLRLGATSVMPNDDSGAVEPLAGTGVSVDDGTSLGITVTYMVSDTFGVEVLGALPFSHDITGNKGAIDGVSVGKVDHLPPTVTAQYHFKPASNIRPYVGAGINYTTFMDEKADSEIEAIVGETDISLDDSFGLALSAGVDIDINEDWYFNTSVWYIDIDTEATLKTAGAGELEVDVEIDPWVVMLGVGTRF